ncbi:Ig-like domain-containing protein [Shewanella sp.]|uniref:Ig-like domain-containing protein n=1 Tax=Shewanella sp. TaxID=50422 RepID=UPI001EC9379A|nr:Ig-like domain-containing protein [Shewanella sp.]NRB22385.1 Ig-like domain-containing protein [Shewanella sp.]
MSLTMFKLPLALWCAVMLSACGGDDSSSSPSVPESSPVYPDGENQNTVLAVAPQLSHKIDLEGVASGPLSSVALKHDSGGSCDDAPVVSHVSFSIEAGSVSSSCHYQYATQNNTAPGNVTVLITPDTLEESRLVAINVAFVGAGMHDIDIQTQLGSDFPANYVLDEYLMVLGVGTASKVPGSIAQIEFNAGGAGFALINYTLSHSVSPEMGIKVGSINISVSDDAITPPTAQNDSLDYYGSGPFEIDIAQLVDSPVEGAAMQLVAVHGLSLDAWIDDADNNNLTNTRFLVQTHTFRDEGSFDISYVVSDNRGGYAVGTITLNLTSPQVIKYNGLKWLPPLTLEEAGSQGLDTSQGVLINTNPAYGPSMTVIRGHAEGRWRCDALDIAGSDSWRQASQADVDAFWFDHLSLYDGGIVSAYAWVESNTPNTSTETDGEGKYWGRSLRTGNANANIGSGDKTAMLCVTESNAEGLNLNTDKAQIVADGLDQVTVDVVFIEAGEPVADKVIYLHATNDAALSQYYVTTDANGRASTTLSATTAGVVRIFSPQYPQASTDIRVIGDASATVLTALTGEASGQQVAIHAKLVDINDNVLLGESLSISCDDGLTCPNDVTTEGAGVARFEVTRTQHVEVGSTASSTLNSGAVTITHAGGGEASVTLEWTELPAPSVLDLGDDVLWHPPLTYAEMQAFAADIEGGIKGHGTSGAGVQIGLVNSLGNESVCNHLRLQETAGRADWRPIQQDDQAIRRYVEGHGEAAVAYRGWPGVLSNKQALQGDGKNTRADYWSYKPSGTQKYMKLHTNRWNAGGDGYNESTSGRMASCVSTQMVPLCGRGVNDDDKANAGGVCLKVAADASGNWFTNTPSEALINYLGYTQSTGDSGQAKSYRFLFDHEGMFGPVGFLFATFDQLGGDSNGNGGQHDRYCQDLAQLRIGGRSDWTRPTVTQLESFYNFGGNKWLQYGFTATIFYGSKTKSSSLYRVISLYNGGSSDHHVDAGLFASCVSTDAL